MSIRATIQTDGPFISLEFEVQPARSDAAANDPTHGAPRQTFGPLRLATVDDAVVLLSQFARYVDGTGDGERMVDATGIEPVTPSV